MLVSGRRREITHLGNQHSSEAPAVSSTPVPRARALVPVLCFQLLSCTDDAWLRTHATDCMGPAHLDSMDFERCMADCANRHRIAIKRLPHVDEGTVSQPRNPTHGRDACSNPSSTAHQAKERRLRHRQPICLVQSSCMDSRACILMWPRLTPGMGTLETNCCCSANTPKLRQPPNKRNTSASVS